MHEISLVKNIFRTLEEEFPGKTDSIVAVHLTLGLLSNVQPLLMQSAFEAVIAEEESWKNVELKTTVVPILVKCEPCGATTEVYDYKFVCSCGRPCGNVVQGEELMISKVEFRD